VPLSASAVVTWCVSAWTASWNVTSLTSTTSGKLGWTWHHIRMTSTSECMADEQEDTLDYRSLMILTTSLTALKRESGEWRNRQNCGRPPNPIPNPISNPKSYPNPDPNPITNPIPNPKLYPNPIPNPKCYRNRVRWSPTVLPAKQTKKHRRDETSEHTLKQQKVTEFGGYVTHEEIWRTSSDPA